MTNPIEKKLYGMVGDILRKIRQSQLLSLESQEAQTGLSEEQIQRIESGEGANEEYEEYVERYKKAIKDFDQDGKV